MQSFPEDSSTRTDETRVLRRIATGRRVTMLGAIICFGIAIISARATTTFMRTAIKANGAIVDLVRVGYGHDVTYAPVFRFTAADGRSYTIKSRASTNPPEFTVGQTVQILYRPNDPAHARLSTTGQLWLLPMILGLGGLIFSFGYLLFWFNDRYFRKYSSLKARVIR